MKNRMTWAARFSLALMAVLAVGLSANRADAISLSDLITTGGTLTVDDKIFSNFSLSVSRPDLDSVAPQGCRTCPGLLTRPALM